MSVHFSKGGSSVSLSDGHANVVEALDWQLTSAGCCLFGAGQLTARWPQLLAAIRHTERSDRPCAELKKLKACGPPPGQEDDWPWNPTGKRPWSVWDPPITENGRALARKQANKLRDALAEQSLALRGENDTQRLCVVSSPMTRCVETALEVCDVLQCPMLIDTELCECFHKASLGQDEAPTLPTYQEIQEKFPDAPIINTGPLGATPYFPESLDQSRVRFAGMLERYLERGAVTQTDFILCSHADAIVAYACLLKPELHTRGVAACDYAGFISASRTASLGITQKDFEAVKKGEDAFLKKYPLKAVGVAALQDTYEVILSNIEVEEERVLSAHRKSMLSMDVLSQASVRSARTFKSMASRTREFDELEGLTAGLRERRALSRKSTKNTFAGSSLDEDEDEDFVSV
eukprot:TRINITY_DN62803_c0_g1_i1.p1 TRINITY_DN62803_c0_g1~~TRINITY_DN62803_c0_g1_i1.p1  ORF type:complete len:406 (+),score=71.39 TRINITY_DN62803_c0_g1_i1:95-1312(+)